MPNACAYHVEALRTSGVQAGDLSPALPARKFRLGTTTRTFTWLTPITSPGFSTAFLANFSLLSSLFSTSSTGPIDTTTKYISNIGVSS